MNERQHEFPRPLSEREAATLRFMVSADDPRLAPLREQAAVATVIGMCRCGCATIDIAVDRSQAPPSNGLHSPATQAQSRDDSGPPLWLILFLDDGWLSMLEIAYVDQVPTEFPLSDCFQAPQVAL